MNGFFLKNIPDRSCLEQFSEEHPEMDPEVAEVYLNFLRLGADVGSKVTEFLAGYNLSPGRMSVMMMLKAHPDEPMTPGYLAELCGVTAATISRLVDGLIKEGHLTRVPDPENRRVNPVKMTAGGNQYMEDLFPGYFSRINQMFGKFSANERKTFLKLLNKLQTNLDETE